MRQLFRFQSDSRALLLLCASTALLIGLSFPPNPIGVFACVGFVPFLIAADSITSFGRFFRYSYFTFFLMSLVSLYWVGGFTHGKDPFLMLAGVALYLWEPLVLTIPALAYYVVRSRVQKKWAVLAFPFLWLTMEWIYALDELAFPWLTLGNTQTYQLSKIQFADITGVYGLSLWILLLNVLTYFLVQASIGTPKRKLQTILAVTIVLLYVAPDFYHPAPEKFLSSSDREVKIGLVQPNIDPWDKWEGASTFSGRWAQAQRFMDVIDAHRNEHLDIAVLPESAILLNMPAYPEQISLFRRRVDSANASLVSGYIRIKYYEPEQAPVTSGEIAGTNIRYDSFNSIMVVQPGRTEVQSYSKMRLVPFAERIPYADQVPFLIKPLRWGVGISNWGLAHDSTVFADQRTGTKYLAMVCYESIFPEFVSTFVKKGAQYLIFITNDSWWGNTSGARQHNQYAVLRAVENRRWVARCANGGISSFIDPMGNMVARTDMYETAFLSHTIRSSSYMTFYSEHGDWLARGCASIAMLIFVLSIGYGFYRK